jgi:hypothetical protein
MAHYNEVTITSSNTKMKFPSFTGILYKARTPKPDECALSSDDLRDLDLKGEPICIEHDRKLGSVGVIVASRYEHPNLIIDGTINTQNTELREKIRNKLVTGELAHLSIGFRAIQDRNTKKFRHRVFEEASLCGKGYYDGTDVISVTSSATSPSESQVNDDIEMDATKVLQMIGKPFFLFFYFFFFYFFYFFIGFDFFPAFQIL